MAGVYSGQGCLPLSRYPKLPLSRPQSRSRGVAPAPLRSWPIIYFARAGTYSTSPITLAISTQQIAIRNVAAANLSMKRLLSYPSIRHSARLYLNQKAHG